MNLGPTARALREEFGITQRAAADRLGVTYAHLCNVEGGKARPSPELQARYGEVFGVDLYVYAWCTSGELDRMPPAMRGPTERLADAWRKLIEQRRRQFNAAG